MQNKKGNTIFALLCALLFIYLQFLGVFIYGIVANNNRNEILVGYMQANNIEFKTDGVPKNLGCAFNHNAFSIYSNGMASVFINEEYTDEGKNALLTLKENLSGKSLKAVDEVYEFLKDGYSEETELELYSEFTDGVKILARSCYTYTVSFYGIFVLTILFILVFCFTRSREYLLYHLRRIFKK